MERCSNSVSSAITKLVKHAAKLYILARVQEHQEVWSGSCGEFRFDPDGYKDGKIPKRWDSYANYCDDEKPETGRASPVTVTTGAAAALTGIFVAVAEIIKKTGQKIPADRPKTFLLSLEADEAHILRFMVDVEQSEAVRTVLATTNMSRDFNFKSTLLAKLRALIADKTLIISGGEVVAELYLNLLKIIAWHAGNAVWRKKRFTLNEEELLTILDTLGLHASEGLDEDTVDFIRLLVAEHGKGNASGKKQPSPLSRRGAPGPVSEPVSEPAVPLEQKQEAPPAALPATSLATTTAGAPPPRSNGQAAGPTSGRAVGGSTVQAAAAVTAPAPADEPLTMAASPDVAPPVHLPAMVASLDVASPVHLPLQAETTAGVGPALAGQTLQYDDIDIEALVNEAGT